MTKTKDKTKDLTAQQKDFLFGNLWKTVLKMMIPTVIMMLVFGIYSFSDTIIGIHFADDSYVTGGAHAINNPTLAAGYSGADQVRLYMGAFSPINMLMLGITFMISGGISTRVAVNLGAGRTTKAIDTLRTGTTIAIVSSVIMIPILIFAAKPWIGATVENPLMRDWISARAFDYAAPIIGSLPFMIIGFIISNLFRVEARNGEMVLMMVIPIIFNLTFDWILMGPAGMDISGGAWATFISNVLTVLLGSIFILRKKSDTILSVKNMIGLKLRYVTLIGVFLVGVGAFFSNFGQSLTTTLESTTIQKVSVHAYIEQVRASLPPGTDPAKVQAASSLVMYTQMQTLMPIFMLVFPLIFSQADAVKPVASFNFGAGDIKRTKKTIWITLLYTFIIATVVYVIFCFGLRSVLFWFLGVKESPIAPTLLSDNKYALWLMMSSVIACAPLIAAQVWFGSTDKIMGNLLVSSFWFLITIPMLFVFKEVALDSNVRYIFWVMYPAIGFSSSAIAFIWMLISMKKHKTSNLDIEAKIRLAQVLIKEPKTIKSSIANERSLRKAEVQ